MPLQWWLLIANKVHGSQSASNSEPIFCTSTRTVPVYHNLSTAVAMARMLGNAVSILLMCNQDRMLQGWSRMARCGKRGHDMPGFLCVQEMQKKSGEQRNVCAARAARDDALQQQADHLVSWHEV